MLSETLVSVVFLTCLGFFFSINLYNILKTRKHNDDKMSLSAEVERPSGFFTALAAFGTLAYFIEVFSHLLLAFINLPFMLMIFYQGIPKNLAETFQIFGLIITVIGYSLFIWSVIARGQYATSWEMSENHKLVTWGPYQYIRHPSYVAYFLMFAGLFAVWPNMLTFIPLIAIPGYVKVTNQEERLLEQYFSDEYREYKKKTGRFIPKL